MWIVASPEFKSESGQCMLVKKALYWFKISFAELRAHLAETLDALCYRPIYADPYVWIWPAGKSIGF